MATGRFVALAEQTDDDEYAAQYHEESEAHGAELAEWHGEQDEEDAWPDEEYEEFAGYDADRGEEAPDEAPHGYARIIREAQRPPNSNQCRAPDLCLRSVGKASSRSACTQSAGSPHLIAHR